MAKTKGIQSNLSERIYLQVALLDYASLLHVKDDDIDQLYEKIDYLNAHYHENGDALEFACNFEVDKLQADPRKDEESQRIEKRDLLKKRLETMKVRIADRIFSYYNVDNTPELVGLLTKMLSSGGVKINKDEAKLLAESICNKKLDQPFRDERLADRLAKQVYNNRRAIQTNLYSDYKTYLDTPKTSALVNDLTPQIVGYCSEVETTEIKLNYSIHSKRYEKNTDKIYTVGDDAKNNRDKIRSNFSRDGGVRENFVKMCGLLAYNGMRSSQTDRYGSNYDAFEVHFQKMYGKNYQTVLDKALSVPDNVTSDAEKDKVRQENYKALSQEFYYNMLTGILSNKYEYDKEHKIETNWSDYINTVNDKFVKELCNGKTPVRMLAFEQPEGAFSCEDSTAERQDISIHHKIPVGAAYDLADQLMNPKQSGLSQTGTGSLQPISLDKQKKTQELVNRADNLCFVVGKNAHQRLEARGECVLHYDPDSMIFASLYNREILNLPIKPELIGKLKGVMRGNPDMLTVSMTLPQHEVIVKERQKLKPMEGGSTLIVDKAKRYYPVDFSKASSENDR